MKITEIGSSMLDHHGLVAGTIQELKIAERIDRLIPQTDPRNIVSTGTSVAAMIINGLGFNNRRLYVVSQFFENKPMNELLGTTGLEPSDLNDDTLGRALDRIFNLRCRSTQVGGLPSGSRTSVSTNCHSSNLRPASAPDIRR